MVGDAQSVGAINFGEYWQDKFHNVTAGDVNEYRLLCQNVAGYHSATWKSPTRFLMGQLITEGIYARK